MALEQLVGSRQRQRRTKATTLSEWPVPRPPDWIEQVNAALTIKEIERLNLSIDRGRPFGDTEWQIRTADRLGLEHTLRREGRPKNPKEK